MEPKPQLKKKEEKLVNCVKKRGRKKLPSKKNNILNSGQQLVKKEITFINESPKATWVKKGLLRKKTPKFLYSGKQMEDAIRACRSGMTFRAAARKFEVPRSTLVDKCSGRTPEARRMGPDPCLGKETEEKLVNWIKMQEREGLLPTKDDILDLVQHLVKKDNLSTPFTNGRPGISWFKSFQKRYPSFAITSCAKPEESDIREWFANLHQYIQGQNAMDIFEDPTRVFNTHETNIKLCPNTGKVISIKGSKKGYELTPGAEKLSLTFLGTFSASGDVVTPMLIYPHLELSNDIIDSIPNGWYIDSSKTGSMKPETFYRFISNSFIPWIDFNNIVKPIILFVNEHKTYTSTEVKTLCEENGIILYFLPLNTTHILHPTDVGLFHPLKTCWSQVVHKFQQENSNQGVTRTDVAPLLKNALEMIQKSSIINGFSATGLFPLNPDKPNYSKIIEIESKDKEDMSKNIEKINSNGFELSREEKLKISKEVLMELIDDKNLLKLQTNQHPEKILQYFWNSVTEINENETRDIKIEIEVNALPEDTSIVVSSVEELNMEEDVPLPLGRDEVASTDAEFTEYLSFIPSDSSEDEINSEENVTTFFAKRKLYEGNIKNRKALHKKLPSYTTSKRKEARKEKNKSKLSKKTETCDTKNEIDNINGICNIKTERDIVNETGDLKNGIDIYDGICIIKNEVEIIDNTSEDAAPLLPSMETLVEGEAPPLLRQNELSPSTAVKCTEYLSVASDSSEYEVISIDTPITLSEKRKFYENEVKLKKRKTPRENLSANTTSENYSSYHENLGLDARKERKKSKSSKKNDDNWKCSGIDAERSRIYLKYAVRNNEAAMGRSHEVEDEAPAVKDIKESRKGT